MSAKEKVRLTMSVLRSELPSVKTIEEDKRCVKTKNNIKLLFMWVDAPKSIIQDKCDESLNKKCLDMPR